MRLIDADALVNALGVSDEDIDFKEILRDAPTIDAVPVVRCKDCRRHKTYNCPFGEEDFPGNYMYCYYGERREP